MEFNTWLEILMKAQAGLRFHCEFYVTAYLIMTGWLMSRTKALATFYKIIITVVFILLTVGFVLNLNDYYTFLNAGHEKLKEKVPDDLQDMKRSFHLMFSYTRYDHLTYLAVSLSSILLVFLIWYQSVKNVWKAFCNWGSKKTERVCDLVSSIFNRKGK